ncbi:MAG TPA: thermonuclease family protein [Candidatus Limnocylindrales bacterium]
MDRDRWRKRGVARSWGICAIVFVTVALAGCASDVPETGATSGVVASAGAAAGTPVFRTTSPAPSQRRTSPPAVVARGMPAKVIRVVDGDTIHARLNGKDEDVRIIGLDSPETSKPNTPVECFAREATAAAKRLLRPGDHILLQADPTQAKRDRFGRLLAHVFLANGTLFAETMIRHGWAVHDIYGGVPSIHADRLAAAQDAAKAAQAGLWSPTTCNGNPHEATSAPP